MDAYIFTVDLVPLRKPTPIITASQYDVGRPFLAHIQNSGEDFTIPSGATVHVNGKKGDNNIFSYQATYSGSDVYFETEEQMTPLAGDVSMEISISVSGMQIGSANFKMRVEASVLDGGVDSETAIGWVEESRQNANAAAASASQAAALVDGINLSDLAAPTITASTAAFPALAANDTGKVLLGKISKWFTDLRSTFLKNNGTTTESGYALDARYGKTLADQITSLNSSTYTLTQADNSITQNTNLNDYRTSGRYKCVNTAIAQTVANTPITAAFNLTVEVIGSDWIHQTVTRAAGIERFERYYNPTESAWNEWSGFNNFSGYVANVDANNYIKAGIYHLGISTNSPYGSSTAYGLMLVIECGRYNDYTVQVFISSTNNMYFRFHNNNGWMAWRQVTAT